MLTLRRAFYLLLLGAVFVGPAQAQSTITIGDANIESAGDGGNANLLLAQQATLSQAATIDSLSFYVTTAAGKLILGIYDASGKGGLPGKLLAETSTFAPVNGWNTQNVITPVSLPAGTYWLAYLPNNNNLSFVKQNNSGNCYYYSHSLSTGMPATFSKSPNGCTPTTWSLYATLTPSGGQAVNGACGSSSGADLTSAPTSNLCSAGTASAVTGSGPWNWTCMGINGGTNAQCMANLLVNAACGPANGVAVSSAPTTGLCSAGMASAVTGTGPWNWTCAGQNGGSTASCSAPLISSAVNGECGSSSGVYTNVEPTSGLCNAGTATAVSGTGPWTWSCDGTNGGTNASCEAYTPTTPQDPGPSAQLFSNPYYSCVRNYYVATNGSDSNDGLAPTTGGGHGPWLTIQHADTSSRTGGDCINVEPGTYAKGALITHGGNAATSTGYVVYRCTTMDGCIITDPGTYSNGALSVQGLGGPNYIMFDGFTLSSSPAQQTYSSGYLVQNTNGTASSTTGFCCHHLWFLNSIVSGYGQAGFSGAEADFIYVIHNIFTDNAAAPSCNNGAQGSGIGMVWPIAVSGYTLTPDDMNNPVTGSLAAPGGGYYHQVYEWNITGNNHLTPCGNGDTDGNGIIMDTWAGDNSCNGTTNIATEPPVYAHQGLVAFNVTYNNGGKGIQIFANDLGGGKQTAGVGITVANNSSYDNNLDTNNKAGDRAEINETCGGNNLFINNIAYAIRTKSGVTDNNNDYVGDSSGGAQSTWSNNVGYCGVSGACEGIFNGAVWVTGKDPANPDWINVGNTSAGSETTPPNGTNFGLKSGSPAIGYGLSEPYLPASAIDAGACSSQFTTCP